MNFDGRIFGNALHLPIADNSIQMVMTSPPYFGLRDYGIPPTEWGGDPDCEHEFTMKPVSSEIGRGNWAQGTNGRGEVQMPVKTARKAIASEVSTGFCIHCDCWKGTFGLEPTPDLYIQHTVDIFREVRRVLKPNGTLWLNLGDSYAGSWGSQGRQGHGEMTSRSIVWARQIAHAVRKETMTGSVKHLGGLKPKDMLGMPWSIAKALQAPYYAGRMKSELDRIWLAATIDAEGTICGFDHDRTDGNGHRSGCHIAITNTSELLLENASRIWPASRSEHQRGYAGHLGKRPSWRWIVHGIENKIQVLRELFPYLIVKKRQAIVAYTLLLLMRDAKKLGHTTQKDAVIAKRRVLTQLLSDLNQGKEVTMPKWLLEPESCLEPGWYLRMDIIWSKNNPMPESVFDRPTKSHEYIFLLSKSKKYFYDRDGGSEPVTGGAHSRGKGVNPKSTKVPSGWMSGDGSHRSLFGRHRPRSKQNESFSKGISKEKKPRTRRNLRSVWKIPTQSYPDAHYATFPPKLVEPCVRAGSRVGDFVLDPFAGSGTVAMVSEQLGRRWVAVDLGYQELQGKRLEKLQKVLT